MNNGQAKPAMKLKSVSIFQPGATAPLSFAIGIMGVKELRVRADIQLIEVEYELKTDAYVGMPYILTYQKEVIALIPPVKMPYR